MRLRPTHKNDISEVAEGSLEIAGFTIRKGDLIVWDGDELYTVCKSFRYAMKTLKMLAKAKLCFA